MMGLQQWVLWTTWFLKQLIFMLIWVLAFPILLKVYTLYDQFQCILVYTCIGEHDCLCEYTHIHESVVHMHNFITLGYSLLRCGLTVIFFFC